MRSLFITCILSVAACGGGHHPATPQVFDPELAGACGPMVLPPVDQPCTNDKEGRVVPRMDDPSSAKIGEILRLEGDDDADAKRRIVALATDILGAESATVCASQVATWHRGLAEQALELWVPAFMDYGNIIKDGSRSPFYVEVGPKLQQIEGHVPDYAFASCQNDYRRIASR